MSTPYYASDLTDEEWQQIEPLLPPAKPIGNQRTVDLRAVVNAIFYRADHGTKWRALPREFPAWQTVYGYFRLWVKLGLWESVNTTLVRAVREQEGRIVDPSLAIIDSQSVKLGQKGAKNRALTVIKR